MDIKANNPEDDKFAAELQKVLDYKINRMYDGLTAIIILENAPEVGINAYVVD